MQPIYFDNHATTRIDPRVLKAMQPSLNDAYGNAASRSHILGMQAKAAVERARGQVAALIGGSPKEIVWTSGATEADNLAILGFARKNAGRGRHIVTSAVEHKAVLDPCRALEREGFELTILPVDSAGRVDPEELRACLRADTTLVSIMAANNEVGTIQPVGEIGVICREAGVAFHTDAAQAFGSMTLADLPIDLVSGSAHKMYGPKGIGFLYVRRGRPRIRLEPLMFGGGHERGLRPGTLPVHLIVGLGEAARLASEDQERIRGLRDRLWDGIVAQVEGVHLNGAREPRLSNNLNVSFDGVEAEALMMSMKQVACSSGSACTSASLEPSHVLRAMGVGESRAHGSIRFGLGRFNTIAEVDTVIGLLAEKVPILRALNPMHELSTSTRGPTQLG